jgi:hypothetical protein
METTHYMEGRKCFAPLEKYIERIAPEWRDTVRRLPWEYMGHDDKGNAHYREREEGNRLCLNPNGRFGAIHAERKI